MIRINIEVSRPVQYIFSIDEMFNLQGHDHIQRIHFVCDFEDTETVKSIQNKIKQLAQEKLATSDAFMLSDKYVPGIAITQCSFLV